MKRRAGSRVSSQFWIDLASKALSQRGPDALTIDALCRRAKKTKGSFYAHFDSHEAFLAALAAYWRLSNTEAIKQAVDANPTSADSLVLLNRLAARLDATLELGMRRLADKSKAVSAEVASVDRERITYLAGLYRATRGFSRNEAADLARIEYAAFVGLQVIDPGCDPSELERLYRTFMKLTGQPA